MRLSFIWFTQLKGVFLGRISPSKVWTLCGQHTAQPSKTNLFLAEVSIVFSYGTADKFWLLGLVLQLIVENMCCLPPNLQPPIFFFKLLNFPVNWKHQPFEISLFSMLNLSICYFHSSCHKRRGCQQLPVVQPPPEQYQQNPPTLPQDPQCPWPPCPLAKHPVSPLCPEAPTPPPSLQQAWCWSTPQRLGYPWGTK